MEKYTKIFKLITALSNVADVKLNLFYDGCLDNSNINKLLSFASKISLTENKRKKHVEDLKISTNELLLGLDHIEVLYNNYRLFIYFSGLNCWIISEVEYRDTGLFVKSYSHGDNENEIMDKEFYMYVPMELSHEVIKCDIEDSIALAKLLDIDNVKHMEDVFMKI